MQKNSRLSKKIKKAISRGMVCTLCVGALTSCGGEKKDTEKKEKENVEVAQSATVAPTEVVTFEEDGETFQETEEYVYTTTKLNVRESCSTDSAVVKMLPERAKVKRVAVGDTWSKIEIDEGQYFVATEYLTAETPEVKGHLIAIDAGHQESANEEQEPIGPDATETKDKNFIGTKGVATGEYEYELTLEVAKKLEEELKSRGYEVFMVRESNDFNMSTKERSQMAEESGAEVLLRLHANGSKVEESNGAMTICGTKDSPYVADLYEESYRLSKDILVHYVKETGAKDNGIWETDVMSGINWSSMPVSIVELGYMSNPAEDERMQEADYQDKMVKGIADGLDAYFEA